MLEQLEALIKRVLPDDNALLLSVLLAPFDALPSWHRDMLAQKGEEPKRMQAQALALSQRCRSFSFALCWPRQLPHACCVSRARA